MGLFRPGSNRRPEQSLIPTKPAPLNIFTQAVNSINEDKIVVGNFTSVEKDQSFDELFELASIAKEKGMNGQVLHMGRRIIATALEKKGMSLLKTREGYYRRHDITRFHADGRLQFLDSKGINQEWEPRALSTYNLHMPDQILRDVPAEIVGNAKVFVPRRHDDMFITKDPIIAVEIYRVGNPNANPSYAWWAGVFIWD